MADHVSPQLLLVEDDAHLRPALERHFLARGFAVRACENGTQGLAALREGRFDLVLLDIMLPGVDGLSLLDELRRRQTVPVMLMSALGAEQDRISGFTRGADDYLPKPFSLAELDARVDALLRRVALDRRPAEPRGEGGLSLDEEARDVTHQGRAAGLTGSEYRLLATLREQGRSILLVEETASRALPLADDVYLLDGGRFAWHGAPSDLIDRPELIATYLGG